MSQEAFTATVVLEPKRTVLEVFTGDPSRPEARLVKAGDLRARAAYELFVADEVTGQISPSGALDADGRPVGLVNLSGGTVPDADIHPMSGARHSYVVREPTRWAVVQPGLPRLLGEPADRVARLSYNRVTSFLGRHVFVPTPSLVAPVTIRYRADDSAGFTVRLRTIARRGSFEVTIDDARIDRRLVFACLTALAALVLWTPTREGLDLTGPFRRK